MFFRGRQYDIYIDGVSKPLRGRGDYDTVMVMLENDLKKLRGDLQAWEQGSVKMPERKAQLLLREAAAMEQVFRRHQEGERFKVVEADYIVGALFCIGGKKSDEKPVEVLRVPIFRSHSYVVEQFMVGIETTNVSLQELGRENPIYRLLSGK